MAFKVSALFSFFWSANCWPSFPAGVLDLTILSCSYRQYRENRTLNQDDLPVQPVQQLLSTRHSAVSRQLLDWRSMVTGHLPALMICLLLVFVLDSTPRFAPLLGNCLLMIAFQSSYPSSCGSKLLMQDKWCYAADLVNVYVAPVIPVIPVIPVVVGLLWRSSKEGYWRRLRNEPIRERITIR